MDKHIEVKSTPAANWRQEGKTDPHNTRYECQRVDLTMGQLTDDEIANAVFLCDHRTSFDSIVYLTAAKDRIRWLSRSNEALIAQLEAAQKERDELKELNCHFDLSIRKTEGVNEVLRSKLEAAERALIRPLPIGELLSRLEGQTYRKWYDDDELDKMRERAEAAEAKLLVPEGYCIMPESLTAENGAKVALSGEFFTETHITCEECGGDCDEDDPCKHCNDLGVQTVRTAIGWSTIKDIHKMAVGATAIRPVSLSVEGNADAE